MSVYDDRKRDGPAAGLQPFASRQRMVLRETPCSRASALTFIDVALMADFGVEVWSHKCSGLVP